MDHIQEVLESTPGSCPAPEYGIDLSICTRSYVYDEYNSVFAKITLERYLKLVSVLVFYDDHNVAIPLRCSYQPISYTFPDLLMYG